MVYCVVNTDSLVELTAYQIVNEIRKGDRQGLHLPVFHVLQRQQKNQNYASVFHEFEVTWLGEDFEARGETGQAQFSTDREARTTAEVAWAVETRRLQNSKERFGNNFLKRWNAAVHEMIPSMIILKI